MKPIHVLGVHTLIGCQLLPASQINNVDKGFLLHFLAGVILGFLYEPEKGFVLGSNLEADLTPTIVWALEEVAFMFVLATVRFTVPSSILALISS